MGEIVEPRTLSGFMELLPKDQVIFEKIKSEMEKVYQKYGFFPLDTPVLEDSRILLAPGLPDGRGLCPEYGRTPESLSGGADSAVQCALRLRDGLCRAHFLRGHCSAPPDENPF